MGSPLAPGLFTWPSDDPHLLAGRCEACQTIAFPVQKACPSCTASDIRVEELPTEGTLWSWTVQTFCPKAPFRPSPEDFVPYGVGYVQLGDSLLVETRLTEADPARLAIGSTMRLVIVALCRDADGDEIVTFAFEPVGR